MQHDRLLKMPSGDTRPLVRWLMSVAVLVIAMVVVGGITRLTESGLSITEWKPVTGALPPLSQAQWQAEFARYQQIPQYQEVNGPAGMTLSDYKFIYFWEWLHRLLGRLIGLAFAVPLAWFWMRGRIPEGFKPRLLALLALGALQGAVGWWMVSSGLAANADVKVSAIRLATHLSIALVTLAGLVWTALDLAIYPRRRALLTGFSAAVLGVLALQLFWGALMAGLRAGYVAPDWPLMQGRLFPEGVDWSLGATAFVADPYLVHFIHRWLAWVVVGVLVVFARHLKRAGSRAGSRAVHSLFGTQILLGIATVMTGVNLTLAACHQLVGAMLLVSVVTGAHTLGQERRG